MRKTIKSLEEELVKTRDDLQWYKDFIEQIKGVLKLSYPKSSKDIVPAIEKLLEYKMYNEGAIRPERETIEILREIIRWQVNPESAQESKVFEKLHDFKNRGM